MYPPHNSWIQVPDLLQCRSGSIPTLLWQLADYQKEQYTYTNTLRGREGEGWKKRERQALLQQFFTLLKLLLHDFHRNPWMHEYMYCLQRSTWKIVHWPRTSALNRHILSLLHIQSSLNNFQSISSFPNTKGKIFYRGSRRQDYSINEDSKYKRDAGLYKQMHPIQRPEIPVNSKVSKSIRE